MHMVDRVINKNAENKSLEESKENGRKSQNLLSKSQIAPRQEKKILNLFEPVLSKTNDVIKEYSSDERAKLEKVIHALKSEKETAENKALERVKEVNERSKEFEVWKEKYLEMEKENYNLRLENQELKQNLQKERNVINDLMKDETDKLEVLRKNEVSLAERRVEELKKENAKLVQEKFAVESVVAQQRKQTEEISNKFIVLTDENAVLKREQANLNEYIGKKERQIKTLIDEINKGKEKGTAESFVQQTDKVRILEEELRKQDDLVSDLKKSLSRETALLSETKMSLDKTLKEHTSQKSEIQELTSKLSNTEKILEIKEMNLKMLDDLKINYIQSKQNLADIVNLIFESKNSKLIEETDRLLTENDQSQH